ITAPLYYHFFLLCSIFFSILFSYISPPHASDRKLTSLTAQKSATEAAATVAQHFRGIFL
ncbi:MAG: hypothetical protein LBC26_03945, partial [Oscillospiraceae bacterium]|nr:hypothetical protein [Oscillospiraceae bacterium]